MSFYHKGGVFPQKKHITYYQKNGKDLYWEELVSTKGFSGVYSTLYHTHMPTRVSHIKELASEQVADWPDAFRQCYHFFTEERQTAGDFVSARNIFLQNDFIHISTANVTENTEHFYRNGQMHELIFVHHGRGTLYSEYGKLAFTEGDYIILPKGILCRFHFDDLARVKLFIAESGAPFEIPAHFRNDSGQLLEHAPYAERDFRVPEFTGPVDQKGEFTLILKMGRRFYEYTLDHHPLDVAGWDGYLYPYAFNIKDYSPIVGKLHLPPSAHLVFTTPHFVVCNFVPRLFDFHPEAIPAPYYHQNIDSDEILYYVEGNFMSRKGIKEGSITLHPMGITHGPQPGKTAASIGQKDVYEYAVMIDTFTPISPTQHVKSTMAPNYPQSWLDD